MRITRADRSVLSDWWFTVDRLMFFGLLLLMGAGIVLSLAASPPIAAKYDLEPFYFVRRQAMLVIPCVAILFAASTLTPTQIRRASLVDAEASFKCFKFFHDGKAEAWGQKLPPATEASKPVPTPSHVDG